MTTYAYQELPHHEYWHLIDGKDVKIEDGIMYIKAHSMSVPFNEFVWEPVHAFRTFAEVLKAPVPCAIHVDQLNELTA